MAILDSYKGYQITHIIGTDKWYITYPNEIINLPDDPTDCDVKPSVYTHSLEKAYEFIDEMVEYEW